MEHQIILIGKDITSAYHGIKEFWPDHIHLIYTNESKAVPDSMLILIPTCVKRSFYKVDAYDAASIIEICRKIHSGYSGKFFYNLSEGTKIMAFAALKVARENNAHPFYITQRGNVINLNTLEKVPMKSVITNREILQLGGHILTTFRDIKKLEKEDVKAAKKIKQFIEKYPKDHERIQTFFGSYCKRYLNSLPLKHTFANTLQYIREEGKFNVSQNGKELLSIEALDCDKLYFEGRWWEVLVADQAKCWSETKEEQPEIWHSVIFHGKKDSHMVKSEIDLVINSRHRLIIIECKSGQVTQNDVYKLDAVREIYGGDISRAVLASYHPISNNLKEKCESLQISLFAPTTYIARTKYLSGFPAWISELEKELQM